MPSQQLGKTLIALAVVLACVGVGFYFSDRLPFLQKFGKLPGDITFVRGNTRFYFPLATCVLLSLFATALAWLLKRK